MALLDHEEMRVLSLDTKNQVVSNQRLYQGTANSAALRGAEVFRTAVARNCPAIILCHNHPSGDPTASPEDIQTTEQLVEAGRVLDIELLDHIIIGKNLTFRHGSNECDSFLRLHMRNHALQVRAHFIWTVQTVTSD